jgi:hypothetical protein
LEGISREAGENRGTRGKKEEDEEEEAGGVELRKGERVWLLRV